MGNPGQDWIVGVMCSGLPDWWSVTLRLGRGGGWEGTRLLRGRGVAFTNHPDRTFLAGEHTSTH